MSPADAADTTNADADIHLLQALQALPVCIEHCRCPDHWHVLWAGNKAAGQGRMLHAQQDFLAGLLPRYLKPAPRVMIAGAADTGALDVLCAAIDDPGVHYSVLDLCPAPLELVRHRATERRLSLDTARVALDEARADQPWDLVFIHYTLAFMAAPQRLRFLQHLRQDLAPGGSVLCAVREKQRPVVAPDDLARQQRQRAADWARDIEPRFEQICRGQPGWLAALRQGLPAYAQSRMEREDTMPSAATVSAEFASSGFDLLEAHRNPGQVNYGSQDLSPPGSISTWIGVFRPSASG